MDPGDVVAERFEIEREAGAGGMGVVYRAIDRTSGEPVALKVLHGRTVEEAERFLREGRLLVELRHPRIVRYVAQGTTPTGQHWLAMEWLEGEDLGARLDRAPLSTTDSVRIAAAVADALGFAHERGVVHRDVKPHNLHLEGADPERAKVLDFGIARNAFATRAATRTGALVGTPGYMSPEQARGDRVDARTDVFALGCVLYECLTGRPAFVAEHVMALLAKVLLEEAPRLAEIRPDLPPPLADLVDRMLAKDAAARPENGAAVAAEIARLGDLGDDVGPRASVASPAITVSELRLLSVVVLGTPSAIDPLGKTLASSADVSALRAIAAPFGARTEALADGSVVVVLQGAGAATDQAARAARCALALATAAPGLAAALSTGRGDTSGRWPVGEAIDRAVRLLREAKGPGIAIDDVTKGLLDDRFVVDGGVLSRERESDGARTLLGKPTPCVGRDPELALLSSVFEQCASEPVARAVLVTGAAGVGKSRVRHEILRRIRAREEPVEVLVARGDPMRAGSPLGLAGETVRRAAGILEGEALALRQEKLGATVARTVAPPDRTRVTEFLAEIAGAPFADGSVELAAARADPILFGDQVSRAFETWLGASVARHPVVVVLEDVQWGDLPSLRLVDAALRALVDRPLFVLALARPEVRDLFPNLFAERGVQEVRLGELTKKAAERLVREVLGAAVAPEIVARVVDRAAGNPLALEEILRAVAEGRGDAVPGSVLAMVQARLERLPTDVRRALRAASVFGRRFWQGGLVALLGGHRAPTGMDEWIAVLVEREIASKRPESRFAGEIEWGFRHAIVQEAAYATLTDADRALAHRLAADWLEGAGETDAVLLAEHCERGGQNPRAAVWWARAAEQALGGNDFVRVLETTGRAIACGATGETLGLARLVRAEAQRWRGEHADAQGGALHAMGLLPRGGARWCEAAGEVALLCGMLADGGTLVSIVDALRAVGAERAPDGPLVVACARAATECLFAGRYDLADALLETIARAGAFEEDPAVAARILVARATRALVAGDHGAHLALREAAAERFERAGNRRSACVQRGNLGFAYVELGAYEEAEMSLRAALVTAERMGLEQVAASVRSNLGLALTRPETLAEAVSVESAAVAAFEAQGDVRMEGAARSYLSAILAAMGDLAGAEREARRAVEILAGVPPIRAFALATLAEAMLAGGRPGEALAPATEAMAILEGLGSLEEGESTVRLAHAEALFASGDAAAARTAIASASKRLMTRAEKIGDPDLRRSFLERVAQNARTIAREREWG